MRTTTLKNSVLVLSALLATGAAATAAVSNFDTGVEGWIAQGDTATPLTFSATGGQTGGYAWVEDSATGGVMYFSAPAAFLGDQSAAYGFALTFDLLQRYTGGANQFADEDVLLTGGGLTLAFDTAYNPTNNVWTSYSVLLSETAGWRVGSLTGATATQAQMQTVLGNLTNLSIRAEYQTGGDTDGIDNVQMIPEPATYAWIGGLLALGLAGWRRFRR